MVVLVPTWMACSQHPMPRGNTRINEPLSRDKSGKMIGAGRLTLERVVSPSLSSLSATCFFGGISREVNGDIPECIPG